MSLDLPPYANPVIYALVVVREGMPWPVIGGEPTAVILWRSAHGFGFEPISSNAEVLYYSAGHMHRVGN